MYRAAVGQPPLYPNDPHILAVASDSPAPADLRAGVAWLDLNAPAAVVEWIDTLKFDGGLP